MTDQAEKRGQLIRHLEDAPAVADEDWIPNRARTRRSAVTSIQAYWLSLNGASGNR